MRGRDLRELVPAGWRIHPVASGFAVHVDRGIPPLPTWLDREIDRLWEQAQITAGGRLFNGRIFSADRIESTRLFGHWTEYRRFVAQSQSESLFEHLGLRPSATGGVLVCDSGVLFGRRPADAIYQPGLWQLPPAGSIDPRTERSDGTIDVVANLLIELNEELGLPASCITATRLLGLVEHAGSHVLDLGIALHTALDEAALREAHAAGGNEEYREMQVVPLADLAAQVAAYGPSLTPQANAFLAFAGLLPAGGEPSAHTAG